MIGKPSRTILPLLISATLFTFAITTTFTVVHADVVKITKPVVGGTKPLKVVLDPQ